MRWIITGGILALVVTVYALVDLTVTDDRRIRHLNRVLWVVLIVVLPVIGAAAWLAWGKGPRASAPPMAPDDDPSFSRSTTVSDEETDRRIADLEAQLAALDDEDFGAAPEAERPAPPAASPEPRAPEQRPAPKPKPKRGAKPDAGAAEDDVDGEGHRATGDGGDSARA
ncbi:Phospholipase_D-nuclease N-terminal [Agrococcus baldri]|uniref:Phospholipase_D-nuclease N-terminal n=1 Tax=Agrococcus baldri TaxID=153730 RepID=A0AA94HLJ9_9MICO|nr:PLDc N-terminal domain-containing protein [Agrococcus baldri]SFS07447.1 Phospholipase_D-nuclease N-terminal [Agrococcus baldri]